MKIKLSKRIFSIMMSIFMALSLLPAITLTVHASIKETGTGTKSDPYKIGNAENLFEFANIVNIIEREDHNQAACAILTQNIDLDEYSTTTWTPIGMSNKQPYTGTFDGKGFTISNLTIQNETGDYLGLFGCVMRGVIKNVGIKNANIKGKDCIGGVCGRNDGTIKNCSNAGNVSGKSRVGGVCGYNSGTIENCSNTGKVSGNGIVGGVCGGNYGTIKNCSNAGTVLGTDSSTTWGFGGVCGDNYKGAIVNCSNAGDVSGNSRVGGVCGRNYTGAIVNCSNAGDVSAGNNSVGGVCGYNDSGDSTKATIKNCSNTGKVSGNDSVGGVCGCNGIGSIENCSNAGAVLVTDSSSSGDVGGVCGYNIDTIENCSNAGAVSGSENIGGVCGYNNSGDSTKATIKNCYNIGDVSEGKNVGGVCGHNSTGTIENCYNTGDVSGSEKIGGVCGHNKGDGSKKATIENCYNIGDVSGTGSSFVVGGVCGYITGIGAITNCYYDTEVCSVGNAYGGSSTNSSVSVSNVEGLTTEKMTGDASGMNGIAGNTGVWHFKDIKGESSEGGSSRDYLYYPHLKEFESTEKWPPKVRLNKVTFITTGESNKVNYLSSLSSLPESYKISDDVTDMDIEYYGKSITIDSEFFSGYTNLQRLSVSGNAIIAEKSLESTKINVVVLGKPGETSAITLQDNLGIKDAIFVLYGTASSIFKLGNNCTVVYDLTDGAKIENITGSCVVRSSKTDIFSEFEIPLKMDDSETTTAEATDASTSDDNSGTSATGTATVFTPKLLTNFLSALFVGSVVTLDTTEGTYDLSGYENALSSTNGLVVLKGQETTDLPVILLDGTSKIYVNLNLQDQVTINFYTTEKYEKISCSFLDDKKVVDVVPESDKKTIFDVEYFQYRCPLNADQMSRIIKVSYSNDKGSYTRNCSVEAYIQRVIGLEASGNIEVKELLSLKNLVRATYLYGCAVRLCFEASHLDAFTFIISKIKEYIKPYMADFESECEKRAKAAEPKTEPESEGESQSQAAIGGIFKNSVSYTLLLQEKITLRVTFTGEEVDLSGVTLKVQYNGSDKGEVVVKDKNGKIEVNGFSPAALDKEVTLIATKSGLSEERISVSPLDYICLGYLEAKKDCNENLALLMQSMYYYYISAKAYETDEPSTN